MEVDYKSINIEKQILYKPALEELANVLKDGLKQSFKHVSVSVADCPNLTEKPFHLAQKGLNGNAKVVDIGGPPYLLPLVKREKIYDLKQIVKMIDSNPAFIIGAGAGPYQYAGTNCEGIYNLVIDNDKVEQHTRIAKVNPIDITNPIQEILPNTETKLALLGNLFICEGKPGKVVKVEAKIRTDPKDFITNIRQVLETAYKDKIVGLGGTFLVKEGKAKQHIMPDFSKTPINNDDEVNEWLKFYNMSAPLIALGTFVNRDPGLDLRIQHFHSFSLHNEGGHYHNDITPDIVEYLAYFNVADEIYRIDRPRESHQIGRD